MLLPEDALAAVTNPDPYAFYAALTSERPIYLDQSLGCWVAAGAQTVTSVLTSDLCRVRPSGEPVPRSLLGSPAADIFRHLVRMNDGEAHYQLKRKISAILGSLDTSRIAGETSMWSYFQLDGLGPRGIRERLSDYIFTLPVYVMGSLLGIPQELLPRTALWMGDFVRCLAPASSPAQIERGKLAAGCLSEMFQSLLLRGTEGSLLAELGRAIDNQEETSIAVANGIGFISQAYEATAGLIGNTLLALALHPEARKKVIGDPNSLRLAVSEVLRYDSPVQNTRRFLVRDGIVAGHEMKAGDAILVILAAANRDPSVNPRPEVFDLFRWERRIFTFGAGTHICPGEMLATTIAEAAVRSLIMSGLVLEQLPATTSYRASANVRIPLFTIESEMDRQSQASW